MTFINSMQSRIIGKVFPLLQGGIESIESGAGCLSSNSSMSTRKKLVLAFLLPPIVIPASITVALGICFCALWQAVSIHDNDSRLSRIVKQTLRGLVAITGLIIMVPCVVLNLVISVIPCILCIILIRSNPTEVPLEQNNKTEVSLEQNNKKLQLPDYKEFEEFEEFLLEESEKLKLCRNNRNTDNNETILETVTTLPNKPVRGLACVIKSACNQGTHGSYDALLQCKIDENNRSIGMGGLVCIDNSSESTVIAAGLQVKVNEAQQSISIRAQCDASIKNNRPEACSVVQSLMNNTTMQNLAVQDSSQLARGVVK
jgi:hypothetical protein